MKNPIKPGVMLVIALVSLVLLLMIIALAMPAKARKKLRRIICRGSEKKTHFKTGNTIFQAKSYKSEIFEANMQRSSRENYGCGKDRPKYLHLFDNESAQPLLCAPANRGTPSQSVCYVHRQPLVHQEEHRHHSDDTSDLWTVKVDIVDKLRTCCAPKAALRRTESIDERCRLMREKSLSSQDHIVPSENFNDPAWAIAAPVLPSYKSDSDIFRKGLGNCLKASEMRCCWSVHCVDSHRCWRVTRGKLQHHSISIQHHTEWTHKNWWAGVRRSAIVASLRTSFLIFIPTSTCLVQCWSLPQTHWNETYADWGIKGKSVLNADRTEMKALLNITSGELSVRPSLAIGRWENTKRLRAWLWIYFPRLSETFWRCK